MNIKYQVFISSTYIDLKEARQAAMRSTLATGNIPTGMELFLADNQSLWPYITSVIDDCDIYVLVVGGRYGSIAPDGLISYTEKEYDYAVSKGKPILCFLQKNHQKLQQYKRQAPTTKEQINQFRGKLEQQAVSHWTSSDDLESRIQNAITKLQNSKSFTANGWIQAGALSQDYIGEFVTLFDTITSAITRQDVVFQQEIKERFSRFVADSQQWAKGEMKATGDSYVDILVDLYRKAETSVFSTSIVDYTDRFMPALNNRILAAHRRSSATVTRIFIFNDAHDVTESHLTIMKDQAKRQNRNGDKIEVRVYVDNEYDKYDLAPITRNDFVVIDKGQVIGITSSLDELGADFYFDNQNIHENLENIQDALMDGSQPLDKFLEGQSANSK